MITLTNERDIAISHEEVFQHDCAIKALNVIHFLMGSNTNKGQFLQFKRALDRANQVGNMAPVAQKIIEYVTNVEVDLEIADIYANAIRDKINERGVIYVDYTKVKERRVIEQGGKCANRLCHNRITADTAHVGHIIPKKVVGNTLGEDNIQAICPTCNRKNHTNYDIVEFIVNRKLNHNI